VNTNTYLHDYLYVQSPIVASLTIPLVINALYARISHYLWLHDAMVSTKQCGSQAIPGIRLDMLGCSCGGVWGWRWYVFARINVL